MHRPCIFHILVSTGIDMNAKNRHGNTALHVTALQNDCSHVGDLLAAGIDYSIKNRDNKTAVEIPTRNKFWKTIYDKYQPGIFQAVDNYDVEKVLHLLHCWARVDALRIGKTLRQYAASRKYHDLVFHIDRHKHSLGAIYAILESDHEKTKEFIFHGKCDINLVNFAREGYHILQHAIKIADVYMVRLICKANVNVNLRVLVQGYLKAPLFFAAIGPNIPEEITWTVLKAGADFTLKDERGRNAAVYAIDKTNRTVSCKLIEFMMKKGLDFSQRDMTGVTLRDVARFARRRDILALIDKAYVRAIRTGNMAELNRLKVMGYDGMLIHFNYRDTFIYASGNETEEVLNLTKELPRVFNQVKRFHTSIRLMSQEGVSDLVNTSENPSELICARDKGGRMSLHLCVLNWRSDLLKLFLAVEGVEVNAVDNVGRTPYHYACALEEEAEREEFQTLLVNAGADLEICDHEGRQASSLLDNRKAQAWIKKERKTRYGMERYLACVDKYEELCHMMKYKGKSLKHFNQALCRFPYPVAQFPSILGPLMPEYRDLVFEAMDKGKEDIATRLIQLGSPWTRKEAVKEIRDSEDGPVEIEILMTVEERARQLGFVGVCQAIEKKKAHILKRNQNKAHRKVRTKETEPQERMSLGRRGFESRVQVGEKIMGEVEVDETLEIVRKATPPVAEKGGKSPVDVNGDKKDETNVEDVCFEVATIESWSDSDSEDDSSATESSEEDDDVSSHGQEVIYSDESFDDDLYSSDESSILP